LDCLLDNTDFGGKLFGLGAFRPELVGKLAYLLEIVFLLELQFLNHTAGGLHFILVLPLARV
jgi:hypothetical protein